MGAGGGQAPVGGTYALAITGACWRALRDVITNAFGPHGGIPPAVVPAGLTAAVHAMAILDVARVQGAAVAAAAAAAGGGAAGAAAAAAATTAAIAASGVHPAVYPPTAGGAAAGAAHTITRTWTNTGAADPFPLPNQINHIGNIWAAIPATSAANRALRIAAWQAAPVYALV
jgi:hypothetical protein